MSSINLNELAVKMLAATADIATDGSAEVQEYFKERLDLIAQYAKATEDDYIASSLTQKKYEEHKSVIDHMAESVKRVCESFGKVIRRRPSGRP